MLQRRDTYLLLGAHLLDRRQRVARCEHPGVDRVSERVGHLLPGRPAAWSNNAEGRQVPMLNEPLAGAPRITAPSQLRIEQVKQRAANLTDLQVPERRLDNPPDVSLICLPRR